MEVILLDKVKNLGGIGDKVNVKNGYGRNFLIPQGKAVRATAEAVADFEARKAELEVAASERLAAAQARAEAMNGAKITIVSKAGDEGKLFGSVGPREIAEAASNSGISMEKQEVLMPDGAIRDLGDYEYTIQVHPDVAAQVTVSVIAE